MARQHSCPATLPSDWGTNQLTTSNPVMFNHYRKVESDLLDLINKPRDTWEKERAYPHRPTVSKIPFGPFRALSARPLASRAGDPERQQARSWIDQPPAEQQTISIFGGNSKSPLKPANWPPMLRNG